MKSIVVAVPQSKFFCTPRVYSPMKSKITYFIRRYGSVAFFIAVLFAGMIFGAVKAGSASDELMSRLDVLFSGSITLENGETPARTFINSFGTSFMFLALLFCLSLSPLGIVGIPLVMFFRGFGYGISSGYLCITYGFKGLIYYIFVLLVGAFVSSLALVYSSQYCIDFSMSVFCSIIGRHIPGGMTLRAKLGILLLNCAYTIILTICASLLDTGLYYLIGGLFSF